MVLSGRGITNVYVICLRPRRDTDGEQSRGVLSYLYPEYVFAEGWWKHGSLFSC